MYNDEQEQIKVFRTTVKQVISNLSELKNINCNQFKQAVEDGYAGYNYEGEDEVIGYNNWVDINNNGKYELNAKVNHESAYEFTLYIIVKDGQVTVTNVL